MRVLSAYMFVSSVCLVLGEGVGSLETVVTRVVTHHVAGVN